MRESAWPMRSSSSEVRTMKVTSGDALVIKVVVNYLHADRTDATVFLGASIPQARRDARPIVRRCGGARGRGHRGAQARVIAQSRERGVQRCDARVAKN